MSGNVVEHWANSTSSVWKLANGQSVDRVFRHDGRKERERERQNRKTKQQQAQLRERVGRVAVPDRGASEYTR